MSETIEQLTYFVPGVSCGHCSAAVTAEVEKLAGVSSVDVDLKAKRALSQVPSSTTPPCVRRSTRLAMPSPDLRLGRTL